MPRYLPLFFTQQVHYFNHAKKADFKIYQLLFFQHEFANRGIKAENVEVDLPQMMKAKNDSVTALTGGELVAKRVWKIESAAYDTLNSLLDDQDL